MGLWVGIGSVSSVSDYNLSVMEYIIFKLRTYLPHLFFVSFLLIKKREMKQFLINLINVAAGKTFQFLFTL